MHKISSLYKGYTLIFYMTSLTLMLQRSNPLSVTSRKMKIMEAFSIIQAYKQPERRLQYP